MNYAGTDQHRLGWEAYSAGTGQIHCPFDRVDQYNFFMAWRQGWRDAQNAESGDGAQFKPDWSLKPAERMAVRLSIALHKHIPRWPGATDEQLQAVAEEILKTASNK